MAKDTRRFKRIDIEAPAKVEIIESRKKQISLDTYVSNLSASGAFFPSLKSVTPGRQIKVGIFLLFEGVHTPGKETELIEISVSAVVTRSDHFGTAVAFGEDYSMTSSQIYDDLLVTRDVETYPAAVTALNG
jgi:hypothetical protein